MGSMSSRDRILEAAIVVFAEKGFYSAHMEEIAEHAAVNKAMVYYYFGSKEKLLSEVLLVIFEEIASSLKSRFFLHTRKLPDNPVDRFRRFVETHFDVFAAHQNFARIMVNVMAIKPEELKKVFLENHVIKDIFAEVLKTFQEGYEAKLFRNIDYRQLLISIVGMNLVYFVTKPIAQVFLLFEVTDEKKFIQERKKFIVDLLLNGILEKTLPAVEVPQ